MYCYFTIRNYFLEIFYFTNLARDKTRPFAVDNNFRHVS